MEGKQLADKGRYVRLGGVFRVVAGWGRVDRSGRLA